MILDLAACEYMKLEITTEPETAPTDWEASIDDGATWATAHNIDGVSGWLVAGPNYDGDSTPDFTTTEQATPVKIRLVDLPETVIRGVDQITTKDL